MSTITHITTYDIIDCAACGQRFGVDAEFIKRRREDHETFYCPSGHKNYFSQNNEAERLRAQLDQARADANYQRKRADRNYEEAEAQRRSAAARKGVITKMRKKIAAGHCPVVGCTRAFTNIMLHMAVDHPDFHDHELPEEMN